MLLFGAAGILLVGPFFLPVLVFLYILGSFINWVDRINNKSNKLESVSSYPFYDSPYCEYYMREVRRKIKRSSDIDRLVKKLLGK